MREAERPGTGNFPRITLVGKIKTHLLTGTVNRWVVKNNREIQLETIVGRKTGYFVAFFNFDGFFDPQKALRYRLFDNAGRLDQKYERRG